MYGVTSLYTEYRSRLIRGVLDVLVFVSALLVYPSATIVIGALCLVLYGGYEIVVAGLLLDALIAPGPHVLGEFHYTILFLLMSILTEWIRRRVNAVHNV